MHEHGKKAEPGAKTETTAPSKAATSPNPTRQPTWTNALGSQPTLTLQPKLTVNQPGDEYEEEADRVAAQVMRMATPAVTQVQRCACGGVAGPDGECTACKAKRLDLQPKAVTQVQRCACGAVASSDGECPTCKIQRLSVQRQTKKEQREQPIQSKLHRSSNHIHRQENEGGEPLSDDEMKQKFSPEENTLVSRQDDGTPSTNSASAMDTIESGLNRTRGMGQALPDNTRQFMQNRFDADFSQVRVHTDSDSNNWNQALRANAFTTGNDIYYASGQYQPGSPSGDQLTAHELTHVIQQNGAVAPKHDSSLPIQRSEAIGNWAHSNIEDRLRDNDANLITEAPIPGGTSDSMQLNDVGFADLYKADNNIVAGVQGNYESETTGIHEDKNRPLQYKNMPQGGTTPGSKWGKIRGSRKYGPILKGIGKNRTWDTTPDFPANFQIGEIKPLFLTDFLGTTATMGLGLLQTGNYRDGFKAFVERVHKDSGKTRATTTGTTLNMKLPPEIDYNEFSQQHKTADKSKAILKANSKERVWVYPKADGLYVYFLIPHPYTSADYPNAIEKQLQKLDPLLAELRKKHPKINGSLAVSRKSRLGNAPPLMIQRAPKNSEPVGKWGEDAKKWEEQRLAWERGTGDKEGAKEFLKEEAAGPRRRVEVNEKLNVNVGENITHIKEEPKKLKRIDLWSGMSGKVLGKLRFMFGGVFEKLENGFIKLKEKFQRTHKKSDSLNQKGGIFGGWKKTATKIIIRIAVKLFKELLVQAFAAFAACVNGMIAKIIDRYVDDAKEELREELEPVYEKVETFQTDLEEKFGIRAEDLAKFVEAVEEVKVWVDILNAVEAGVRIGVQILSCGSPPGLGCLWGLVAQLAIGTGLELLASTDYFESEIATPAARKLVKAVAGDALRALVGEVITSVGLEKYAEGVGDCWPPNDSDSDMRKGNINPNDPQIKKAREAWEAANHDLFVSDLLKILQTPDGKQPTAEDIERLVKLLRNSGKTAEELSEILKNAKKDPSSGKFNLAGLEQLLGSSSGGETGGKESGKGNSGKESVPVADANNLKSGGTQGTPLKNIGVKVRSESGHTTHTKPNIAILIWDIETKKSIVLLTNVPTEVTKRKYHPNPDDEKTASHLRVHYKLLEIKKLDPYVPDATLTGDENGQVYGYLKYR